MLEIKGKYCKEEEGLAEAISRFYAGSNYWGD